MLTTRSAAALRAYLAGESEYRLGRYSAAVQHFRRAVDSDSSFTLAYYRVSNAANWTGEWDLAVWASTEAVKRAARLSHLDRMRVEAWDLHLKGDADDAARLYRAILTDDSTDVETRLHAADIDFHWGGLFGRAAVESRAEWERALAYDPANADGLLHVVRLLAMERQRDQFDRYAAQLTRLNLDGDRAAELRVLRAFTFGTTAERKEATDGLRSIAPDVAASVVWSVAAASYDLGDVTELLMRRIIEPHSFTSRQAGHYAMRASMEWARGRLHDADATLDSAAMLEGPGHALGYRAMLALLPVPGTAPTQLRALRDTLSRLPSYVSTNRALAIRLLYLLGALSVRLGDDASAARYQSQLERPLPAFTSSDSSYARKLEQQLRAARLRAAGKPAEALAALGEPRVDRPGVWSYTSALERLLRAELLTELGRTAEAVRWYATFPDPSAYDIALLPLAELRQGELLLKLGRRDQARAHFERFLALWSGADRELAPFVAGIRKRFPD
jgi:tetratricopeptide (TPR) repeat protein